MLCGRFAGKKAVVLKCVDDDKDRAYGHCIVAGVAKAPLQITKSMCKDKPKMKKIAERRSRMKTFVKCVNYSHVMPTRFNVESALGKALKEKITADTYTDLTVRRTFVGHVKKVFEAAYKKQDPAPAGVSFGKKQSNQRWLFQKLRF